jgi:hypothetical protein
MYARCTDLALNDYGFLIGLWNFSDGMVFLVFILLLKSKTLLKEINVKRLDNTNNKVLKCLKYRIANL